MNSARINVNVLTNGQPFFQREFVVADGDTINLDAGRAITDLTRERDELLRERDDFRNAFFRGEANALKIIILICIALALTGCGKVADAFSTGRDGYVVRCIEGTKYVLVSSADGNAITPLLGTDGRPKGCEK